MSYVYTWIVSGAVHLVVAFLCGWLVFKRPAFMDNFFASLKARIGLG